MRQPCEEPLELGKDLLDRIKVWAAGRQIAHRRAGPLDRFSDASNFVRSKIVHHDGVTLAQGRGEKVLDIGQETCAIHRCVEHTGRGDRIVAERGNECRRHPMPMRHSGDKALSARRAPNEPRHIGLRPGFINEDETFRVQAGLACTPLLAGFDDIGAVLLGGTQ